MPLPFSHNSQSGDGSLGSIGSSISLGKISWPYEVAIRINVAAIIEELINFIKRKYLSAIGRSSSIELRLGERPKYGGVLAYMEIVAKKIEPN